ncbi:MAG: hypothetical protein WC389_11820 [Lutibacter sp.]|jgi:hypothetical protein
MKKKNVEQYYMNSTEWDKRGWSKFQNPSGEMVRKKTYERSLPDWANAVPNCIKDRKILAQVLQVPFEELLGDLCITVDITKYKQDTRRYHLKKYRRYLKTK